MNILSRRQLIVAAASVSAVMGASLLMDGCGGSGGQTHPDTVDYLNFFLNLEYLEAEFYLRATSGTGLTDTLAGGAHAGNVTGGGQVTFSTTIYQQLAKQIAQQEVEHVTYLQSKIGSENVVARPTIDLTEGFRQLGVAAGFSSPFNPFADEQSFLLGAFFFEDLMAGAYAGSVLRDPVVFCGICGNESYHAAAIRTLIISAGGTLVTRANLLSGSRTMLGGGNDQGVTISSGPDFSPSNLSGGGLTRLPQQILNIVYQSPNANAGGFFPSKLNGFIR